MTRHPSLLHRAIALGILAVVLPPGLLWAETHFVEAESFTPSSPGWKVASPPEVSRASRVKTMWGADGPGDAVATQAVTIETPGRFRIWVRSMQVAAWRGPFRVAVAHGGRELAAKVFDLEVVPNVENWDFAWQSFDVDMPAGEIQLTLAKHEQKNCVGYVRHVDCLLLTSDLDLKPDHLPYGPQTFLRVTVGSGHERPVYLHLFADHYRGPWYGHHAIGRSGLRDGIAVPAEELLTDGATSPWCNISHVVYQDSGCGLNVSLRHSYHEKAPRLRARLDFGRPSAANSAEVEIVKSFEIDAQPNGVVVVVPPDLDSPDNVARLRRDADFAEETGRRADSFAWPTLGKRPVRIPFLVSAQIAGYDLPVDAAVQAREQKTLDYFGYNGGYERVLHGLWLMKGNSYCRPDVDAMRERARQDVATFRKAGRKVEDLAYCMLMDEPTGQPASFAAQDDGYRDRFRAWLQAKGLTPADLLEADWEAVRPVVESEREQHPALHYYTQRFRTVALGDFLATQRQIIEEAYGRSFPTLVNFSDGAVYHANFCGQGVDYFELLNRDDTNAIWGEDWAALASTSQCAAYDVDLMRAAARKRGQSIGHYLIAHAGRTSWDAKLKATGETARGVRQWMTYCYGPSWGSHEGGPTWKNHLLYAHPEQWAANAEIVREIGAVEDWLLTAKPAPAEVAILYSSSADIWTMNNFAFGFDRMHTWLALSHAQTPIDIVSEQGVVDGELAKYRVCYLSGPNLTRAAAEQLKNWCAAGGILCLSAGAASRDEFNRPLDTFTALLPAERGDLTIFEPYQAAGKFLFHLTKRDEVRFGGKTPGGSATLECLAVKQTLKVKPDTGAEIIAHFQDDSPAAVTAPVGKGRVYALGYLPGLAYVKPALVHRTNLEKKAAEVAQGKAAWTAEEAGDVERLTRSINPWRFPADIRETLHAPVRRAQLAAPLICDTPLVDAVFLPCDQGVLISLANHTLAPLPALNLRAVTSRRVTRVESVHRGQIPFEQSAAGEVRLTLPLAACDWVQLICE